MSHGTHYQHLSDAANTTNFPPRKPGEDAQTYLTRLVRAIGHVSDEAWNKIPPATQAWYNEAVAAINKGENLPEMEGFVDTPVEEQAPASEVQKTEAPAAAQTEQKDKEKAEKPKKEPKPPVEKKPRARGISSILREVIILHPDWKTEEIEKHLVESVGLPKEQVNKGTIATFRTDTLGMIQVAKTLGYWRDTPVAAETQQG